MTPTQKRKLYSQLREKTNKCYFCNIAEEDFINIYGCFYGGRRGHRLEVERLKPKEPYSLENCVLACAACNCAKSDVFTADEMLKIGQVINQIWKERNNE